MKWNTRTAIGAAIVSLFLAGAASNAAAESRTEISLMGGVQGLSENDTAIPEDLINIPAVATVTYRFSQRLAAEGEFTWMIPVTQSVDVGSGGSQDMKTQDILAYQANLRADFPLSAWAPYLVAGAGALTFLSDTDADRIPQLAESQTILAVNFGFGVAYGLSERWGLRADAREFVAFPADDAAGLSDADGADEIWMGRGTLGLSYRF